MPIHTPRFRNTRSRKHYQFAALSAKRITIPKGGTPLSPEYGASRTRTQRRKAKLHRLGIAGQKR
jgi:hypothetical protein